MLFPPEYIGWQLGDIREEVGFKVAERHLIAAGPALIRQHLVPSLYSAHHAR